MVGLAKNAASLPENNIDLARERLLTVDEAARYCRVSRRTINNWFENGLEWIRLGGRRVYTTRQALGRFGTYSQPRIAGALPIVDRAAKAATAEFQGMCS